MDANHHGLSFDFFTSACQFVKLAATLFLSGIHWRYLIDVTAQNLERGFDLFPGPRLTRFANWSAACFRALRYPGQRLSGDISCIGGVTQPNHRLVLFFQST